MKLSVKSPLGKTGLSVPQVVYGTSYLGNLYRALSMKEKLALMKLWFECTELPVVEQIEFLFRLSRRCRGMHAANQPFELPTHLLTDQEQPDVVKEARDKRICGRRSPTDP